MRDRRVQRELALALRHGCLLATYSIYVRLIVLFVALLPPVLCTIYVREAVDDFAIAGHVEALQNLRFVEHVIRRQRTVAAFEALKVVQCLRDPKMLLRVVGHQSIASPLSISSEDLSTTFKSPEQPKAKKSIALSESPPEDYQPTPETSSTPFAAKKRALKEHTRSSKRRHRASVAGLTQLRHLPR